MCCFVDGTLVGGTVFEVWCDVQCLDAAVHADTYEQVTRCSKRVVDELVQLHKQSDLAHLVVLL